MRMFESTPSALGRYSPTRPYFLRSSAGFCARLADVDAAGLRSRSIVSPGILSARFRATYEVEGGGGGAADGCALMRCFEALNIVNIAESDVRAGENGS